MRLIFEEDIEHEDFMEVILNGRDYDALEEHGVTMEFPFGLHGKRLLNLHIRMEKGAIMPLIGGKAAKSKAGFSENIKSFIACIDGLCIYGGKISAKAYPILFCHVIFLPLFE